MNFRLIIISVTKVPRFTKNLGTCIMEIYTGGDCIKKQGSLSLKLDIVVCTETGDVEILGVKDVSFIPSQESILARNESKVIKEKVKLSASCFDYGYIKFGSDSITGKFLDPGNGITVVFDGLELEEYDVTVHRTQKSRIDGLTALFKKHTELREEKYLRTEYNTESNVLYLKKAKSKSDVIMILKERKLDAIAEELELWRDSNGKDFGWNSAFAKRHPELADEFDIYG